MQGKEKMRDRNTKEHEYHVKGLGPHPAGTVESERGFEQSRDADTCASL